MGEDVDVIQMKYLLMSGRENAFHGVDHYDGSHFCYIFISKSCGVSRP